MPKTMNAGNGEVYYYGTGRRKEAIAKVRIKPGSGQITVNGKTVEDYFGLDTLLYVVHQPLVLTETEGRFDIICDVKGGGIAGQAGAVRHGIARALNELDAEEYRTPLKRAGFLTRDSRVKERKKYGLKGARKAPQFSKR